MAAADDGPEVLLLGLDENSPGSGSRMEKGTPRGVSEGFEAPASVKERNRMDRHLTPRSRTVTNEKMSILGDDKMDRCWGSIQPECRSCRNQLQSHPGEVVFLCLLTTTRKNGGFP